jgi:hypothetical protein
MSGTELAGSRVWGRVTLVTPSQAMVLGPHACTSDKLIPPLRLRQRVWCPLPLLHALHRYTPAQDLENPIYVLAILASVTQYQ